MFVLLTRILDLKLLQFVALNYKYQYFDQVQNAISDYIQKQVPKSNVEAKFEWTTTGEDQEVCNCQCTRKIFLTLPPSSLSATLSCSTTDLSLLKDYSKHSGISLTCIARMPTLGTA